MEHIESTGLGRREFLGKCLATGTGLCLGGCAVTAALAQAADGGQDAPTEVHKFQRDAGLTYENAMRMAYAVSYIPTMKVLQERIGLDALESAASEAATRRVAGQITRMPNRELSTLAGFFKNPSPVMANALTKEIVEDTGTAFEIRVTECLWAKTFIEAEAADLGHHCVCQSDFAMATAFNPQIELIRDKTLMKGDDCCNHRYVANT